MLRSLSLLAALYATSHEAFGTVASTLDLTDS